MQAISMPAVSPQPNKPSLIVPCANWNTANRNDTPKPFATPYLMLKIQIGSIETSVMEPPNGSSFWNGVIRLSTIASASIIAPSTSILVLLFFMKISSFHFFGFRIRKRA